jgi:hypothetical protein
MFFERFTDPAEVNQYTMNTPHAPTVIHQVIGIEENLTRVK